MSWYKKAINEQLDLFDKPIEVEDDVTREESEAATEVEDDSIFYLGSINLYGADFVDFQIRDKYYRYRISFSEWVRNIESVARKHSPWKAQKMAEKKASEAYEMEKSKEYPYDLTIKREIVLDKDK